MEGFKTPLPVPEFYSSSNTCYSTKKARRMSSYRRKPPPLTAPAGCYSLRFRSQKPHRISFKPSSEQRLSFAFYNESKRDSYFKQSFVIESKLGEGCFGEVYKVRSKEDSQLYAVKKAMKPFQNESDRAARLSEVHKHESLPRHPNLVRFIKAWEERGRLYIQTELCKMTLSELCESIHDLPESLIWKYLVDLLLAVKHLHDHDLIHMDIKPENIFISDDGICKLGDFGLVCDLQKDPLDDVLEGDSKYLAPEVLQNRIGKHVDIFSLGITILEISSDLDLPSEGMTWHLLREGHLPEDFLTGKSTHLHDVIRLMLTPNETQRPSAAQMLALPSVISVWRWRRKYVACSQINTVVRSSLMLMWAYFVLFGRTANLSKKFLRLAKRRLRSAPPAASDYANDGRYDDDGLSNGNVTKELIMDSSSSSGEESAICGLSDIHCDEEALLDKSFSTPPADLLLDDMQVPEFCTSSPDGAEFDKNFVKEKSRAAARPPCNSTPANENRMRRRIIDMKSPNDLKRLRSEKQFINFTSSPVRLSRIISQHDSSSDSSMLMSPDTMPDPRYGMNGDIAASEDLSVTRPIPPKNLLDAFEAESSETEVES